LIREIGKRSTLSSNPNEKAKRQTHPPKAGGEAHPQTVMGKTHLEACKLNPVPESPRKEVRTGF